MNTSARFIIIDDDQINNKICNMAIGKIAKAPNIKTFLNPYEGFNHIVSEYSNPAHNFTAITFLDISMPGMDAWEFLNRFDTLDAIIKNRIKIYVLSSSDDKRDMNKAQGNKNVTGYLVKPLTREIIKDLILTHDHGSTH